MIIYHRSIEVLEEHKSLMPLLQCCHLANDTVVENSFWGEKLEQYVEGVIRLTPRSKPFIFGGPGDRAKLH